MEYAWNTVSCYLVAQNVLKIKNAHSSEFKKTTKSVVGLMTEWVNKNKIEKEIKIVIRVEQCVLGHTAVLKKIQKSFRYIKISN